jgi:uncharacterized protein (TIGR00369 family)
LDYLQRLIARNLRSPMAEAMNMRLIEASHGSATFEAFPSACFYNPQRRMHGGYVATLLDSALGCAVQSVLPANEGYGTIELKVNYVRKLTAETGRILCRATVLHAGRRMQTAEAKVTDEAGNLYAHGSGTFLVYRP